MNLSQNSVTMPTSNTNTEISIHGSGWVWGGGTIYMPISIEGSGLGSQSRHDSFNCLGIKETLLWHHIYQINTSNCNTHHSIVYICHPLDTEHKHLFYIDIIYLWH